MEDKKQYTYEYKRQMEKGEYPAFRGYITRGTKEPGHYHDFLEIVYILSGSMKQTIDGVEYETSKGDLLLIDTNQAHGLASEEGASYANIVLLPDFISENLSANHTALDFYAYYLMSNETPAAEKTNTLPLIRFRGNDHVYVDAIMNAMCDETVAKRDNYNQVISNYLNILFYMIVRNLKEHERDLMADISDAIPGIIEYLDQNCSNVTLGDIAKKYYYSPSYFSRAFKKYFNKNFSTYMQEMKVEKIIKLLEETDTSIEEISVKLGYSDKRELYRVFKNVTGTTPSAYRTKKAKKDTEKK